MVVAEQYCMSCEATSLVYSKDVASGDLTDLTVLYCPVASFLQLKILEKPS
jgi:hypothetical protein